MSISDEEQQALVAEVLELGESLFEAALEVGSDEHGDGEAMEEIRGAKGEFFVALRMLLKVKHSC